MAERFKGFHFFLVIGISIWLLLFPAYAHFSALGELDMTPPYPSFKSIDQEDVIVSAEKEEPVELNVVTKHLTESGSYVERILHFYPPSTSVHSKFLALRC
jgi:hypothetical protein